MQFGHSFLWLLDTSDLCASGASEWRRLPPPWMTWAPSNCTHMHQDNHWSARPQDNQCSLFSLSISLLKFEYGMPKLKMVSKGLQYASSNCPAKLSNCLSVNESMIFHGSELYWYKWNDPQWHWCWKDWKSLINVAAHSSITWNCPGFPPTTAYNHFQSVWSAWDWKWCSVWLLHTERSPSSQGLRWKTLFCNSSHLWPEMVKYLDCKI